MELAANEKKQKTEKSEQQQDEKEKNTDEQNPMDTAQDTVITQATAATQHTQNFVQSLNIASHPWDAAVLVFAVVSALLYGLSLGRDRIIVILVSMYMSLAVVNALPNFVLNVSFNGQSAIQITTFISVFVVLFFFVSRFALLRTIGANLSEGRFHHTIIFSVLHVGLLISITMSYLPSEIMQQFTPLTQHIFTGQWQAFAWIIAPVVAMLMFGSTENEEE